MKKKSSPNKIAVAFAYVFLDILIIGGIYALAAIQAFRSANLSNTQILNLVYFGLGIVVIAQIIFWSFRIYFILTNNFGIIESLKIMMIVFVILVVSYVVMLIIPDELIPNINSELFVLALFSSVFLVPAMRYVKRVLQFVISNLKKNKKTVRTLIVGAGAAAKIVIDEARRNPNSKNDIIVIIDDDSNKIGGGFAGIPVKGPISEVGKIIDYFKIEEVIIAIANLTEERLKEIIVLLDASNVKIKRLPLLSEMQDVHSVNVIDIKVEQLLGRDVVKLDNQELAKMLDNSTILITGAGGSIGSELVYQIFETNPKTMILFDIYENGVYSVQQQLLIKRRQNPNNKTEIIVLIGSTYDKFRIEQIFKKHRPDYIYHAAAYKHVPLMEDSPQEAIRTNVIGTYNVALMANEYKAKKMILVSTDKAVRPTNVMGATKRFAEMIMQHFSLLSESTTFSCVRFGNVLGSHGSVVPLFTKQIESGGPVTVTHPEITRFFMTIPEATSLILQCSIYAKKSEIFILDMGEPVKIVHLAERMIRQAGYIPYREIEIKFTGLRPGEKLCEEILIDVSQHTKTANSKIYIEDQKVDYPIDDYLLIISSVFKMEENKDIKEVLASIIPAYCQDKKE